MANRNDRGRRAAKKGSAALGPYEVMPEAKALRRRPEPAATGAILVVVAAVIGPLALLAIREVRVGLDFGWHLATMTRAITSAGDLPTLALLLAVFLVLGVLTLVAGGRDEGISGELTAATWFAAVANSAAFALIALTRARSGRLAKLQRLMRRSRTFRERPRRISGSFRLVDLTAWASCDPSVVIALLVTLGPPDANVEWSTVRTSSLAHDRG